MTTTNEIIIYQHKDKKIEVSLREETIWLSLNQIAELFDVQKAAISKHIRNIYDSGELQRESTVSILETVQVEGKRKVKRKITYYNLDVIISVGYRVNSKKATMFRIWATNVLKNYLVKGYAINESKITKEKLRELEKTIKFLKETIHTPTLSASEVKGILEIIDQYTNTWKWLEECDTGKIKQITTAKEKEKITYEKAKKAISKLKEYLINKEQASDIFGVEREKGLFLSALNKYIKQLEGKSFILPLKKKQQLFYISL